MSHRPLPVKFSGRLWENGEFGFAKVREMTPGFFRLNPKYSDYNSWVDEDGRRHVCDRFRAGPDSGGGLPPLGLSHHSNSHSESKRAKRGTKGITSHGRKIVRNACYRLRDMVPQRRLSLLTLTLPEGTAEQLAVAAARWPELLRVFQQRLTRFLKSEGLPGEIVGVFEIQESRQQRTGLPVLHAHLTFVGRRSGKTWAFTPEIIREWWVELIRPLFPDCASFQASTRIETVKKSVENYLGKYLSKGSQSISAIVKRGQTEFLPSAWWTCSLSLRRAVMAARRTGFLVGETLAQLVESGNRDIFKYLYDVKIGTDVEGQVCIGKHGRFQEGIYRDTCAYLQACATVAP